MTAMTSSSINRVVGKGVAESEIHTVRLVGLPGYTYTPANVVGKTLAVISCYDNDAAYDAVKVQNDGTILTIDTGGTTTTTYDLTYSLS